MTIPPQIHALGDLQGCLAPFQRLIHRLETDAPDARYWLVGDLVNRGPQSLATLRAVRTLALEGRLVTVLGNHDLHLLAVAAGARRSQRSDTLQEILEAPDRDELLDWLRRQPLAHLEYGHLLVHAGVLPAWSTEETVALAAEVSDALGGPHGDLFLREMYGNEPAAWNPALTGMDRLRVIVNALTRLRFCTDEGVMEFDTKEGAEAAPAGYRPWFDIPGRAGSEVTTVFGHWSTLGALIRPDLLALDTGCVWGGCLTAVRLSDRAVFRESCPQAAVPGPR